MQLSRAAACALVCNLIVLVNCLNAGPPANEPDFQKQTGRTLKDVRIAVHCIPTDGVKFDDNKICYEIATCLSLRLNREKLKVVDPDYLYEWLDRHPNSQGYAELATEFGADIVIVVEVKKFSMDAVEKKDDFQGRFWGAIRVLEITKDLAGKPEGERLIYRRKAIERFPRAAPVPEKMYGKDIFKRLFLSEVSLRLRDQFLPTLPPEHYLDRKS